MKPNFGLLPEIEQPLKKRDKRESLRNRALSDLQQFAALTCEMVDFFSVEYNRDNAHKCAHHRHSWGGLTVSKHLSLFLGVTFVLVILCSLLLTHAAAWNGVRQNGAPWLQSADSGITIQPAIITGTVSFSGDMAYHYALEQCTIGPRPTGTEAGWQTGDYIINVLEEYEWSVTEQMFDYDELAVRNIVGKKGQGPIVLLGAHYDTRPIADKDLETPHEPIIGGNDGASGVAVLLELARVLNETDLKQEIWSRSSMRRTVDISMAAVCYWFRLHGCAFAGAAHNAWFWLT